MSGTENSEYFEPIEIMRPNKFNIVANIITLDKIENNENSIYKFLIDTGATEHLVNSRLIFKSFNKRPDEIKCVSKDDTANLKSEGVGLVEIHTPDDNVIELGHVIYAENLSENLLSLRKFTDLGLCVYLDNEQIDIYDPISNKSFISGIYKRPYWIIEFELNKTNVDCNSNNNKIVAYITEKYG